MRPVSHFHLSMSFATWFWWGGPACDPKDRYKKQDAPRTLKTRCGGGHSSKQCQGLYQPG